MSQDLKVALKFTTADSAQGFDHVMMLIGVPESSFAHFAVNNNFEILHPPGMLNIYSFLTPVYCH